MLASRGTATGTTSSLRIESFNSFSQEGAWHSPNHPVLINYFWN